MIDVSPINEPNLYGYRLTNQLGAHVDVVRAYNSEWLILTDKPASGNTQSYAQAMRQARLMLRTFKCSQCHEVKPVPQGTGGTGYARNAQNRKVCYACCADNDREYMRTHDRIDLYLVQRDPIPDRAQRTYRNVNSAGKVREWFVTNWPSSLELPVFTLKTGAHNIARTRIDVWFKFEGREWHGVNIGDNDILRCRKLKA